MAPSAVQEKLMFGDYPRSCAKPVIGRRFAPTPLALGRDKSEEPSAGNASSLQRVLRLSFKCAS
jgi:hypothetical protein